MNDPQQNVIGSLLLNNSAMDDVLDILTADDFDEFHRPIFSAMSVLYLQQKPMDPFTVSEICGDAAYLGELMVNTTSPGLVRKYAQMIRDKATEKALLEAADQITLAVNEAIPTAEKIDKAQSLVMAVTEKATTTGPVSLKRCLGEAVDRIDARFNAGGEISGLSTGFTDLDDLTSGFQKANLIILAGRPAMGKTTLMDCIARNVARNGGAVCDFSLEMSRSERADRWVSAEGRILLDRVRNGKLEDDDWARMTAAMGTMANWQYHIDDTGGLSVNQIRARARRLHKQSPLSLITVDYLQLIECRGDNRSDAISTVSRGLKNLAKELDVPVIALSQLNRDLEKRTNKRPQMSDLRDSGAIEQDADVIIFVYRDEVYNPDTPHKGMGEAIVAKQRMGSLGTVYLTWSGHHCRYDNFTGDIPASEPVRKRVRGGFDYANVEH